MRFRIACRLSTLLILSLATASLLGCGQGLPGTQQIPGAVSCGGLAGTPCAGLGNCVDDPTDSCDPAAGGADCPGVCSCVQNVLCTANSVFNSDPSVCACVPIKPTTCGPVCAIYCQYGNVVDASGCPTCACNPPPGDPCATVMCASGTHCDSGKCVSDGVSCGGFIGAPCPGGGKCVDDPNDSCDPAAGGADCPGICSCVQNVACVQGSQFDSSPSVCACVPSTDPCANVKCASGTTCDSGKCVPVCGPVCDIYCQYGNVPDANGCPTCACNPPPPDPCATVKCASGTHCDTGKCVSDGVSCGGLAGIPCPGLGKCVDNPNDGCDPAAGGADCPGICSCVQNVLCTANSVFNGDPSVCACVPAPSGACPPQKCPTPAPASPTMICADGSTAGPTCAPNASGACAWTITTCPTN